MVWTFGGYLPHASKAHRVPSPTPITTSGAVERVPSQQKTQKHTWVSWYPPFAWHFSWETKRKPETGVSFFCWYPPFAWLFLGSQKETGNLPPSPPLFWEVELVGARQGMRNRMTAVNPPTGGSLYAGIPKRLVPSFHLLSTIASFPHSLIHSFPHSLIPSPPPKRKPDLKNRFYSHPHLLEPTGPKATSRFRTPPPPVHHWGGPTYAAPGALRAHPSNWSSWVQERDVRIRLPTFTCFSSLSVLRILEKGFPPDQKRNWRERSPQLLGDLAVWRLGMVSHSRTRGANPNPNHQSKPPIGLPETNLRPRQRITTTTQPQPTCFGGSEPLAMRCGGRSLGERTPHAHGSGGTRALWMGGFGWKQRGQFGDVGLFCW